LPVSQAAWSSRPAIAALQASDSGAGAVIAPGSALEERWIFNRPGVAVKAAGDLELSSALAGMAARSSGRPARALLVGPGSLSDQGGARLLLSSRTARSIEVDLQGTTLVASGDAVADFRAFAPGATAATLNEAPVAFSLEGTPSVALSGLAGRGCGGCAGGGSASVWAALAGLVLLRTRRRSEK
jgi:hypothetical protein